MPDPDNSNGGPIASDPGTLDYYQGWADWMGISLPNLNFNDPGVVLWFENLKNKTIADRQALGMRDIPSLTGPPPAPIARPYTPNYPQSQAAPAPAQPSPLPAPDPGARISKLLDPKGTIKQDPLIWWGEGPKLLEQYKEFGTRWRDVDPLSSPGSEDAFKRQQFLQEQMPGLQHISWPIQPSPAGNVPADSVNLDNTLNNWEDFPLVT